jgi:Mlc titration factor MtfA (ptsG expression regulator)
MTSTTIEVLERDVAFYSRLARADQARFVEKVERFVRTKHVRGVEGVVVDERLRVLVAAPACRLSLNLVAEDYRRLHNVDVHPTEIDREEWFSDGVAVGPCSVWLALDALVAGLSDAEDGVNVGYHEFAHVLDASDGVFDGVPPLLLEPTSRARWIRVMKAELARLRALQAAGQDALLPEQACEDEAELFACATVEFFERPEHLREFSPELFGLLSAFYRQDPLRTSSDARCR